MKQVLTIKGMNCHHCTAAVKEALTDAGAQNVVVSLEDKTATCVSDMNEETLRGLLKEEGFELVSLETLA